MMSEETKRRKLGRGLSSLLGGDKEDFTELDKVRSTKSVPIEFLRPGKYQPRQQMASEDLEDLAHSIREKGVLMPLLVRRDPDSEGEAYEIIAGERRWRAAQLAQLHDVPVIIKDLNDQETLEVALIENLQRQDLSPLEEATGYQRLMDEFSHTQEQLAERVGKSRPHIANMMRLLSLPEEVKTVLEGGAISAGHARALLGAKDPVALVKNVVKNGLNVRQTERLVKSEGEKSAAKGPTERKESRPRGKDTDTLALERDLTNLLGLKVEISFKGDAGALTIHYASLEQLDDILARLSHGAHGGHDHGDEPSRGAPSDGVVMDEGLGDDAPRGDHNEGAVQASMSDEMADSEAVMLSDDESDYAQEGEEAAPSQETKDTDIGFSADGADEAFDDEEAAAPESEHALTDLDVPGPPVEEDEGEEEGPEERELKEEEENADALGLPSDDNVELSDALTGGEDAPSDEDDSLDDVLRSLKDASMGGDGLDGTLPDVSSDGVHGDALGGGDSEDLVHESTDSEAGENDDEEDGAEAIAQAMAEDILNAIPEDADSVDENESEEEQGDEADDGAEKKGDV